MGFLLKEALKTFCGTNQWSYAIFWKIGFQNSKLLIWEEYHCELGAGSSELPFGGWERCLISSETCSSQLGVQEGNNIVALINRMMISHQVNLVGEGIVGRAAFTGKHQWILSSTYTKDEHPPEVINEMHHQFSAGMQTLAVIPVLPHGVVQLGSSFSIVENMAFINEVKSLILQLGCVHGALLSNSYTLTDSAQKIGGPVSVESRIPLDSSGLQKMQKFSPSLNNCYNPQSISSQPSNFVSQPSCSLLKPIPNNLQPTIPTFQTSDPSFFKSHDNNPHQPNFCLPAKSNFACGVQFKEKNVVAANILPLVSDAWVNRGSSSQNSRSQLHNITDLCHQSVASHGSLVSAANKTLSSGKTFNHFERNASSFDTPQLRNEILISDHNNVPVSSSSLEGSQIHGGSCSYVGSISAPCSLNSQREGAMNCSGLSAARVELQKADSFKKEDISQFSMADILATGQMLSKSFDKGKYSADEKFNNNELVPIEERIHTDLFEGLNIPFVSEDILDLVPDGRKPDHKITFPGSSNVKLEDKCALPSSGDDLFDILGTEFKNKLLNSHVNNFPSNGHDAKAKHVGENVGSKSYSASEGIWDSGVFFDSKADHLLDAVVSKVQHTAKQISEDNVSCGTTLTKVTSSLVPGSSPTYGGNSISDHRQGEMSKLSEHLSNAGMVKTCSFKSGCSRDDMGSCSQTTSLYGSQISSWAEQGSTTKRESNVSTTYSKRPDEMCKSNSIRKRLKPGENPRPRPKDRQMIQDRLKELREIVPNGGKCSIDALLERTIKHMLFLQCVRKHADKLKQTGESKIINTESGLLLKDNFEGGATWAYEVGLQSMVCPIIVEDLNPPRQMLVEMLCEERGFILEIADLIRGMGLTILKGVMEARNDKIWARFAVEANRDVTRVEIFMSLVHLLEKTAKAGASSSTNPIENNTLMAHYPLPQAAPIPATGRASCLQ